MSLQQGAILVGYIAAFAVCGVAWQNRQKIAAVFRYFFPRTGAEPSGDGSGIGAVSPVPPRQHQAASELVPDFDAVLRFLEEHNLTDEQLIAVYAIPHRTPDDYPLSANRIRDAVGGNEAAVKAQVAARRPKPRAPKLRAHLDRPVSGW